MNSPSNIMEKEWFTFDGSFKFIFTIKDNDSRSVPSVSVTVEGVVSPLVLPSPPDNPFDLDSESKVDFHFFAEDENEITGELNIVQFNSKADSTLYGLWGYVNFGYLLRKAFEGIMITFN